MKICYPSNHTWYKFIAEDPLLQFGKNNASKIRRTSKAILNANLHSEVQSVNDALLDWFIPLHEKRIQEKEHPLAIDLRELTSTHTTVKYAALVLFEDGIPLGATIFTERKNKLSIAYRTYEQTWRKTQLPAQPSLFMEYEISRYALQRGKQALTHGKDRNPHGIHSSIGLAAFKLSVGCKARLSRTYTQAEIDTDNLTEEALILALPPRGKRRIQKAYLVVRPENRAKWIQLTKHPELLHVEVLSLHT